MKKSALTIAIAVLTLGVSSLAYAQDRDHDRHDDRDHRDGPPRGRMEDRRDGAGPDHNWVRGSRLPPEYRNRQYVVDDWRSHQLRQPPRGYHWVQSGGDYVLAAIATGVIADILLNH